jgi:DNA-binding beta-propeller fold protein YncE
LGVVWAVAVDSHDHVFALHAPARYLDDIAKAGKVVAPPVVEFHPEGNVVRAWGGPGPGYSWVQPVVGPFPSGSPGEHGVTVDHHDNVWVAGGGNIVLKFTHDGKFLLQIGELGKTNGSNDPRLLGGPSELSVDPKTNEVYIADGYINQRILVLDADTGTYKRHSGAYGKRPDDGPIERYVGSNEPGTLGSVASTTLAGVREIPLDGPPPQRFFPSHGVRISKDGLVYVADRGHNRIQVFRTDGTFVKEAYIEKGAKGLGSVSTVALSPSTTDPDQYYLYVGKSASEWIRTHENKVFILRRSDLQVL